MSKTVLCSHYLFLFSKTDSGICVITCKTATMIAVLKVMNTIVEVVVCTLHLLARLVIVIQRQIIRTFNKFKKSLQLVIKSNPHLLHDSTTHIHTPTPCTFFQNKGARSHSHLFILNVFDLKFERTNFTHCARNHTINEISRRNPVTQRTDSLYYLPSMPPN